MRGHVKSLERLLVAKRATISLRSTPLTTEMISFVRLAGTMAPSGGTQVLISDTAIATHSHDPLRLSRWHCHEIVITSHARLQCPHLGQELSSRKLN
ncbi:Hypothetical protein NTJ_05707 [Nesidiocoris tenuis]|uniref:Uncharacterized protein n=1 Tax=Nesidiocoris tenuis TaxID=355587 RepID=A0ABN7ALI0_9HEMI|nr:Hypothetical protein NTJ_05707 [Nesidiocoris tenuis]